MRPVPEPETRIAVMSADGYVTDITNHREGLPLWEFAQAAWHDRWTYQELERELKNTELLPSWVIGVEVDIGWDAVLLSAVPGWSPD